MIEVDWAARALWARQPLGGKWEVRFRIDFRADDAVPVEARIVYRGATTPTPRLLATTMRHATLARVLRRVREDIRWWRARHDDGGLAVQDALDRVGATGKQPAAPTRKPRTPALLAQVAVAYERAWRAGKPPYAVLAKQFGITDALRVRDLVRRAREYGYLTRPPTQGTIEGRATRLARETLQVERRTRKDG